jgi:hypothetical protein
LTPPSPEAFGLLVGLHIASWRAYKDAPYEGFRLISYLRSVLLAAVLAIVITVLAPGLAPSIVVLVGAVYAIERLATEGWKSICVNKTKPSTPSQCGSDSGTTCQPHWDPLHRRGGTRDWYHRRPCRTERHPARPSAPSCAAGHLHRWFGRRLGHSCRRCVEGRPHRGIQRLEVPTQPRGRNGVGGTNLFLTNNWVAVLLASSGFCGGQH